MLTNLHSEKQFKEHSAISHLLSCDFHIITEVDWLGASTLYANFTSSSSGYLAASVCLFCIFLSDSSFPPSLLYGSQPWEKPWEINGGFFLPLSWPLSLSVYKPTCSYGTAGKLAHMCSLTSCGTYISLSDDHWCTVMCHIINCYSIVLQSGNTLFPLYYISGSELRAGSQRTQGLFHLLLLHLMLFPPWIRLLTPDIPIDDAVGTHSIARLGFQPPLIIWCGPSDFSVSGNAVGMNTSQGISEEDMNFDLMPLLCYVFKWEFGVWVKFFILRFYYFYDVSLSKRERTSTQNRTFSKKQGYLLEGCADTGSPSAACRGCNFAPGWGGERVGRGEIAEELRKWMKKARSET